MTDHVRVLVGRRPRVRGGMRGWKLHRMCCERPLWLAWDPRRVEVSAVLGPASASLRRSMVAAGFRQAAVVGGAQVWGRRI